MLYRYALSYPNSAVYYIAPLQKQAKELIWANNRLQTFFLPKVDPHTGFSHSGLTSEECYQAYEELKAKYFQGEPNNTEMRIRFKNGSFIKLDGADQFESYRGVNPHCIAYDEFKDHHPKFHDAMDPNLATFNAPLIVVGTPPEGDEDNAEQFIELADYCEKDKDCAYYNFSSYSNPYISRRWLDKKRDELIARGREDVWLREYMAQRVRSGSRAIFPMLEVPEPERTGENYTRHIIPHDEATAKVKKHHKSWDFFLSYDPASVSCFGVLFGAINSRTKEVVILDEIYEEKKGKMSTTQIYPKSLEMTDGYGVLRDDIRKIYDSAATWFQNEVAAQYEDGLEPAMKDINRKGADSGGKENRLNLIKDLLIYGYLTISERCVNLVKEMKGYRVDEKGKIPKENDHLIDAFRYALANHYYDQVPKKEVVVEDSHRYHTPESDFSSESKELEIFYPEEYFT